MNKILSLIVGVSILFTLGCSASPTSKTQSVNPKTTQISVKGIRPEFLNDSIEMYSMLDNNFKNAIQFSDADEHKMNIYMEKYSGDNIKDFGEKEKQLEDCILEMIEVNINYTKSQIKKDKDMENKVVKQYVEVSNKTKQILGIN